MTRHRALNRIIMLLLTLSLSLPPGAAAQPVRPETMYADSYALIIGISEYTGDWPDLPGVAEDVPAVKDVLEAHGFEVQVVMNPTDYSDFDRAFRNFITRYGQEFDNRLLFYVAGHGKTLKLRDNREMGYIVGANAPFSHHDEPGFQSHSLDMVTVAGYARQIQSKHALFLFDSCFAGSIFDATRGEPEEITDKTAHPVRQFITAGSKDERVPDRSIFRRQFVEGLQGEGDVDRDGYVTAAELGYFLNKRVVKYSNRTQHPQYGKIRDANLDKGDVVFTLPQQPTPTPGPLPPEDEFSLHDLDVQARWQEYQHNLEAAFAQVQEYEQREVSADLKRAAWRRFLKAFGQDAPYSDRDDALRRQAQDRLAYWQGYEKPTPTPGIAREWSDPTTGMEFVWIESGCFQMGSPDSEAGRNDDEGPVHEVCVDGFYMGKYEVTNAQYRQFKREHDSGDYQGHSLNNDDQPAVEVSWEDAREFADWLTEQSDGNAAFRLPTEAEWEYAARAGTPTARFWGDDPDAACAYANVADQTAQQQWEDWTIHDCDDGYAVSAPVGSFRPNAFGLYDMLGNVWEWCADTYHGSYADAPADGSFRGNLDDEKAKLLRGGSWFDFPPLVRSANRDRFSPGLRASDVGVRLVRGR